MSSIKEVYQEIAVSHDQVAESLGHMVVAANALAEACRHYRLTERTEESYDLARSAYDTLVQQIEAMPRFTENLNNYVVSTLGQPQFSPLEAGQVTEIADPPTSPESAPQTEASPGKLHFLKADVNDPTTVAAANLLKRMFPDSTNQPELFIEDLNSGTTSGLSITDENGEVVGATVIDIDRDYAHVGYIAVDEEHRGQGVGQALIYQIARTAIANGATHIGLFTTDAHDYFRKFGFTDTETESDMDNMEADAQEVLRRTAPQH